MHVIHKIPGSIKYKNIYNYNEPKIPKIFSGQGSKSFLRDFYSEAARYRQLRENSAGKEHIARQFIPR